jgi:rod shape-determining protein MreC
MFGALSRYKDVVLVGLCLLVPSVILYAQSRSTAEAGPVVRSIIQLTAPVQDVMSRMVEAVAEGWTRHWQDAENLEDARALRVELGQLRRQVERLEEVERENGRLRDLLHAAPTPAPPRFTAARVVAVGASPGWRTVRIDAGRSDGVMRGMAVLGAQGAVGSVLRTSHGYSDVMLLTDRLSAVDVLLPRTGARGILRGVGAEGGAPLRVEGLERQSNVVAGDEVVCSSLGARFPRGTRVGTVVAVDILEGSLTSTAQVKPAVQFDRLANVMVVLATEYNSNRAPVPTDAVVAPPTSPPVPAPLPGDTVPAARMGPAPAPVPGPAGPVDLPPTPPPDTPAPQETLTPVPLPDPRATP